MKTMKKLWMSAWSGIWKQDLLAPEQAGFRQFCSTENQATYLSQEIEDTFQEQKLVLVSWIDFQKSFHKVWMEGLLVKLLMNSTASNMFNWIKSYLYNRRVKVSVDRIHSKKILLRHGVPQGGVPSPTLSLLFINDLVSELGDVMQGRLHNHSHIRDAVGSWQAQQLDWEMVCCSQLGQFFHHLVHPVPKAKSRHHDSLWNPAEGGWGSNISWCHIWQEADLETTHCQGRG